MSERMRVLPGTSGARVTVRAGRFAATIRAVGAMAIAMALALPGCVSSGSLPNATRADNDRASEIDPAPAPGPIAPPPRDESTWVPRPVTPYKPAAAAPVAKPKSRSVLSNSIVVVDAGHGGKDPGSKGLSPVWEKHIALAIAKEVAAELRKDGVKVVMTRDSDSFIELDDRAALASRTKCDLFVSVHANSLSDKNATGAEIYTSRTPSSDSRRLSSAITAAFREDGLQVRGQRMANYRVLVGHSRPSVLVECGYLTNAGESKLLNTPAYRSRVARAIADGICDALVDG